MLVLLINVMTKDDSYNGRVLIVDNRAEERVKVNNNVYDSCVDRDD